MSQAITVCRLNELAGGESHARRLAAAQFELWGALTGHATASDYGDFLQNVSTSRGLPATFVACHGDRLAGSVNLLECDLPLRQDVKPWLGQLYVFPEFRRCGVGEMLVRAATAEAGRLGWPTVYLFTSGTLPAYYSRLGWRTRETVTHLGAERTVMEIRTDGGP